MRCIVQFYYNKLIKNITGNFFGESTTEDPRIFKKKRIEDFHCLHTNLFFNYLVHPLGPNVLGLIRALSGPAIPT